MAFRSFLSYRDAEDTGTMIPSSLYELIVASMPIPSGGAIVVRDRPLLFLKRENSPARGEWWFPGGRIKKGETFHETLLRKVKKETGLEIEVVEYVGTYNRIFRSADLSIERHDISIVFLCRCFDDVVTLNEEHSECRFFAEIPSDIHPYLLETIEDSGWISSIDRSTSYYGEGDSGG